MSWKEIFLGVIGIVMAFTVGAQTIKVTDGLSMESIHNVFIYNQSESVTTITNSNGEANLADFKASDTLFFQHASYQLEIQTYTALQKNHWKVTLVPSIYDIKGVEVVTLRDDTATEPGIHKITTIDAGTIAFENPATSADMLQGSGDVLVQKSQLGGGSPIIRGFEANKILLVVDGVRMNNAIYRSGHLQNAVTVDANMLERTEILYGPGSVVYGSDALGGVIHFHSRKPQYGNADSSAVYGNVFSRYATAGNASTVHADVNLGFDRWAFLTSVTANDYGDLQMGKWRAHGYDSLGLVPHYAERIDGVDVMVVNDDPNLQVGTGYKQLDVLQKIRYKASENLDLLANIQYSTSTDVPRFDRLNDYTDGELKFAEWYYGPQNRLMTSLNATLKGKRWFDKANFVAAYQRIDEDRVDRRFGSNTRTYNNEDVSVFSFNNDYVKRFDTLSTIYYGVEFTHNDVVSTASTLDIESGVVGTAPTRYPDGGSVLSTAAIYFKYKRNLTEHTQLDVGARYSYAALNSSFEDTTFLQLPFDEIQFNNGSLTGSVAISHQFNKQWQISGSLANGYRSPNVDDYGKVFEKDDDVTVPNDQLKPEYAYSGEVGIAHSFFGSNANDLPLLRLSASAYYTHLIDAIVRTDHTLNGQDSMLYSGTMANIVTNTNASKAQVYGFSFVAEGHLNQYWNYRANLVYTYGRDLSDDVPLAHIPPVFSKVSISRFSNQWQHQLYAHINGWKHIEDYSPTGTDNETETTEDGAPAWWTLNYKMSWQATNTLQVQAGVENILDQHYKPFASGVSGAGRNFILALRANFGQR